MSHVQHRWFSGNARSPIALTALTLAISTVHASTGEIATRDRTIQVVPTAEDCDAWRASIARHGFDAVYCTDRPRFQAGDGAEPMSLHLSAASRAGLRRELTAPTFRIDGARVEYSRPGISEWYWNRAAGVLFGVVLESDPCPVANAASGVTLEFALASEDDVDVLPGGSSVAFTDAEHGTSFVLCDLRCYDARGAELKSRFGAAENTLTISVDDANAVYPIWIDPWIVTPEARLAPSDVSGSFPSEFGTAVTIDGDIAVIGGMFADSEQVLDTGSAYVYRRQSGAWLEQQKIVPDGAVTFDRFGAPLLVNGDVLFASSVSKTVSGLTNAGMVYLYRNDGNAWTLANTLHAAVPFASTLFGSGVSLHGDKLAIGATAAVYVFTGVGTTWTEQQRILVSGSNGHAVSVFGDTVVTGAFADSHGGTMQLAGSAFVFTSSAGVWSPQARVIASDPHSMDEFGSSVALYGDTLAVGAPGNATGVVYVFERNAAVWTQTARLTAANALTGDNFGISISLVGDTLVIGAYFHEVPGQPQLGAVGAAYVFERRAGVWTEAAQLLPSVVHADSRFGKAVAYDGASIAVGAYLDQPDGAAYVYRLKWPSFCFGDGSLPTACPCSAPDTVPSPSGAPRSGCANSFNLNGARLSAVGAISPDELSFEAFVGSAYTGFALLVKGDARNSFGIVNGDGVRCVDGSLVRFGGHRAGSNGERPGQWCYPNAVQRTPVSVATAQPTGQTAYYQLTYRNAVLGFCSPATTNWTNAVQIDW